MKPWSIGESQEMPNKSLKFVPRFALHRTRLKPRRLAQTLGLMSRFLSVLALVVLVVGCASTGRSLCDSWALTSDEWATIGKPEFFQEIYGEMGDAARGPIYWYQSNSGEIRTCRFSYMRAPHDTPCGSSLWEFEKESGNWVGGIIRVQVCGG